VADDRGDKTEQPTGKRLAEARAKGQVAKSPEAGTAVTVLAIAGFLSWTGPHWMESFTRIIPMTLQELSATPWEAPDALDFAGRVLPRFLAMVLPPVITIAVCALAINVAQVGFVVTGTPLAPNWGRLNPVTGFKRLFSSQALVALAKAPLKLAIFAAVAYATLRPQLPMMLTSAGRDAPATVSAFGALAVTLLWRLGLAHALLAAADYAYQRWAHRRSLRMTKEEVKEEARQAEGDPAIRARFRSLHRQYAMKRMMQDVATADVVVTNPTHYAVALRYEAGSMRAPQVVAKGIRLIALQIRERAMEAGVPVLEHKPLAQALYKSVPVGGEIPSALYRAVAEILAYVWALSGRRGGGG
jgi:flagellar biosynthetic protein FlhB